MAQSKSSLAFLSLRFLSIPNSKITKNIKTTRMPRRKCETFKNRDKESVIRRNVII